MITYNHVRFIEQAIRSVMMQETDFDYELIIGEDYSTDGTREIVLQLQKEFPDKIKLILHPENIGMISNFISVFDACEGPYIAFCEGDDYWTDPHKLQTQIDYMEDHLECRVCEHEVVQIYDYETELPVTIRTVSLNGPADAAGVYNGAHTHTSAVVLRSAGQLPEWFGDLRASCDLPLLVWILLQGGKLCFIGGDPMSVHIKHKGGVTYQHHKEKMLNELSDILLLRQHLKPQMSRQQRKFILCAKLSHVHSVLFKAYLCEDKLLKAGYHYFFYVFNQRIYLKQRILNALSLLLSRYFPKIYVAIKSVKNLFVER